MQNPKAEQSQKSVSFDQSGARVKRQVAEDWGPDCSERPSLAFFARCIGRRSSGFAASSFEMESYPMRPLHNATSPNRATSDPSSNEPRRPTPLAASLERARNGPAVMLDLSAVTPAALPVPSAEIAPPVLASSSFATAPDFLDQRQLNQIWSSLQEQLKTVTLSEGEVLKLLNSGILQTPTGKALADLFAEAMLRSIRPRGTLESTRLKEIVDVLCHLPPGQWQAALGERFGFSGGKAHAGVKGFVQSQLDRSGAVRDERIANGELLADDHWETLKTLAEKGRQYIRASDGKVDSALLMLEDARDLRPSVMDAYAQLGTFIQHLEEGNVQRIRWTDHYLAEVKALHDQLKPLEGAKPTWLEWVIGPSWLESLFGSFDTPSASKQSLSDAKPAPADDDSGWLVSVVQMFERSADFHSHVTTTGPRYPESFLGKLLYAFNALDTFGALRLDASHISTARPEPGIDENPARPQQEPNSGAWRNGAYNFAESPLKPDVGPSQAASETDLLTTLSQFIAKADELFTRSLVPWNSASALDDVSIEIDELSKRVCQTTTVPLDQSPVVEVVREQVQGLLQRMATGLVSSGAALLSSAGNLLENNPGRTAGAFAVYVVVSNFYANWFEPVAEEVIDPLEGLQPPAGTSADKGADADEKVGSAIAELFEEFPEFAMEVKQLIDQSRFFDATEDPQVREDLEILLKQPVRGNHSLTYQDYLDEALVSITVDDHDEIRSKPLTNNPLNLIYKRNIGGDPMGLPNFGISESGVAAHSLTYWLIQRAQYTSDVGVDLYSEKEIAPGITLEQGVDMYIKDVVDLQTILDPMLFMVTNVNKTVSESDLSSQIKSTLHPLKKFDVEFVLPRPNGKDTHIFPEKVRHRSFTLAELFAGQHEKAAKSRENLKILWPEGYTAQFKESVANNNFQASHKEQQEELLSRPGIFELWKSCKANELKETIRNYLGGDAISSAGKSIADDYLAGKIKIKSVYIRNGVLDDGIAVSNAVYLSRGYEGDGLFVFLGGGNKVIESPVELFKRGGTSIDDYPELRQELSQRITLKELLGRDDDDFTKSQGDIRPSFSKPYWMLEGFKLPYTPIVFGFEDGFSEMPGKPLDVFEELYQRQIDKATSDIDTLTSTWSERVTDRLLEIFSFALTGFSIILGLPGLPYAALAFLIGAAASSLQYVRGVLSDDPQVAYRHKANAIYGLIAQTASPHIGKALGKVFSKAADSRIVAKVIERMGKEGALPREISKHLPDFSLVSKVGLNKSHQIAKWIPPKTRSPWVIQDKVDRKFKNILVKDRLDSLAKKPQVAEKLMTRSRVLYFDGEKNSYIYRGFAMKGEMRPPKDVFKSGFKREALPEHYKNTGGVSSADGSDLGVQASGYYDSNRMGAFYEGGSKGGYTYLIDGRKMRGIDVGRNRNLAERPSSQLGSNPYEIKYTNDIPGSAVLGAYDKNGKFIPNTSALSAAKAESDFVPFLEKVPIPLLKQRVQNQTMPEN
ncbi:hypothetical protein ACQKP5_02140 [Pseudomonas vancouverensis]|uniref:hypothetical protein n=1 Tax=Pseudomonas vancouverensis TaxID=95300 RepID=UPI003D07B799